MSSLKQEYEQQLEILILKYQEEINKNPIDNFAVDKIYKDICKLYDPKKFIHSWYKKYGYLYDTYEDFQAEYIGIFCKALKEWKPKNQRTVNRYNGKGDFKNFFWGSLNHNYINKVKYITSGKRNVTIECPICKEWCISLSQHLKYKHLELLWEKLNEMNIYIENLETCPFCKSYKAWNVNNVERLKNHIISAHSSYLFEKFNELYPNYNNFNNCINMSLFSKNDDEEEEFDIYDVLNKKDNNLINHLWEYNLSNTQKKIIEKAYTSHYKKGKLLRYDKKIYNCSYGEFLTELEDLQNKILLLQHAYK